MNKEINISNEYFEINTLLQDISDIVSSMATLKNL